ncbi:MAG TPA: hypothetical protein VFA89_24755 [Terriglobales bacterium]|nr:hypothetical protein [Terriglobales bacterium]
MKNAKLMYSLLAIGLLGTTAWAQTPQQPSVNPQSTSSNVAGNQTIRGCLRGSSGTYILMDQQSGTSYTLVGEGTTLAKEVDHQVEVTGQPMSEQSANEATTQAGQSSQAGAAGQPSGKNFQVSSVSEISGHCSAAHPSR